MGERHKNAGLEAIRAIAALAVVYNHVFSFGLIPKNELLVLPGQYATEAVMVFFVLSGVVITLSIERKKQRSAFGAKLAVEYFSARLLRIYPIFIVGLLLAVIAERVIKGTWLDAQQIVGNVFFMQSLPGFIVGAPQYNPPLWSLSNEMSYYVLFAVCLVWTRFLAVWSLAALIAASLLYATSAGGGVLSHTLFVLAFSIPWVIGHLIASWRENLPRIPLSFGVACFVIGLAYARCAITAESYDLFRLIIFALCCCPLLLSIIQRDSQRPVSIKALLVIRIILAAVALLLLWTISSSLLLVKLGLTIAVAFAALAPLTYIDKTLSLLRWVLPALVRIGSISYGIYAIHVPIIELTAYTGQKWEAAPKVFAFLVVTLAISYLMERIVQPRLKFTRRVLNSRAGLEFAPEPLLRTG
jgi:peptidoglycan/LPS O-acetylase OafA/YrhL